MKEELRHELSRKISESFERARQGGEVDRPRLSEEERRRRVDEYARLLIKVALRQQTR